MHVKRLIVVVIREQVPQYGAQNVKNSALNKVCVILNFFLDLKILKEKIDFRGRKLYFFSDYYYLCESTKLLEPFFFFNTGMEPSTVCNHETFFSSSSQGQNFAKKAFFRFKFFCNSIFCVSMMSLTTR